MSLLPAPRFNSKHLSYVELIEKPELPRRPHQPPQDEKQFVRSVDVPKENLSREKREARFASENDVSVLEERRARQNDMTMNRRQEMAEGNRSRAEKKSKSAARGKLDFSPSTPLERAIDNLRLDGKNGDIAVGGLARKALDSDASLQRNPSDGGEKGVSTFGESVPDDVKFGDFTALNTDRHLYYTFYARMEEKIRFRWVTYARAAVFNLNADPRKVTGRDHWVTKLEVILDQSGRFIRAIMHESSGLRSLDSAPVQAFKDAGQFPHPPAEMVKADGQIHVYYAFNVNFGD